MNPSRFLRLVIDFHRCNPQRKHSHDVAERQGHLRLVESVRKPAPVDLIFFYPSCTNLLQMLPQIGDVIQRLFAPPEFRQKLGHIASRCLLCLQTSMSSSASISTLPPASDRRIEKSISEKFTKVNIPLNFTVFYDSCCLVFYSFIEDITTIRMVLCFLGLKIL
jgi:hypothetical protein